MGALSFFLQFYAGNLTDLICSTGRTDYEPSKIEKFVTHSNMKTDSEFEIMLEKQ
jgi:hypothetical protein